MNEFKCPSCQAPPHKHGKRKTDICYGAPYKDCEGLICECQPSDDPEDDTNKDNHGEDESNPCVEANCYHCGWGGRLPVVSNTKNWPKWAKTALDEGWKPPVNWQPKGK